MQLTKGMFGSEFDSKSPIFEIHTGQQRSPSIVHNGGWYNKAGEKLGWGDLNDRDFKQISKGLEKDQLFIVLNERDSFWNFVNFDKPFAYGWQAGTKPDEKAPGVDYVVNHARYIISSSKIYCIDEYKNYNDGDIFDWEKELPHLKMKIAFTMLKREGVSKLVKEG